MSAEDAIKYARSLVSKKARWRHHGRKPWAVDCVGLIELSLKNGGYCFTTNTHPIYGREPWDDQLRKSLRAEFGERADGMTIGDIALMRWNRNDPTHIGLIADYWAGGFSIIHSIRLHGVIETRLAGTAKDGLIEVYRPKWGDA